MEKACDLLKERLASIQEFIQLSQQDDQDSKKKSISSCVVKMKRQEKIRAQKENELLEALFTFKSASKNERIIFEKTSYELMVMLSPQFSYPVQDKGFYTDIAELYIAYYIHINNISKVEEIKVINQNNIYHNFPFLCMLYKGLVEFSKKLFQDKVKAPHQVLSDYPFIQQRTHIINNSKRNDNFFISTEQKTQKLKSQDQQNVQNQQNINIQQNNQIDSQQENEKNTTQQSDLKLEQKEELQSSNNLVQRNGEESFRQLNSLNEQKINKQQVMALHLNRKRGSCLNSQNTINVGRSETPENFKYNAGAQSSTNSCSSASQMFKKYFSSKINGESANEEKKTFLGHQRFYSNYDKEKFLFYQFCVIPSTIPQSNIQGIFNTANSSFSSVVQSNTPINNTTSQRNDIPQSCGNLMTEQQQQMIHNSHYQALSCPQFARRNYFRIVKEAVDDAEFMVFKRNELLAMYYYKNIVSRNNNIAKTIENFRMQVNMKNKNQQKSTDKVQQINNKNQFTLPQLNGDLITANNKNQQVKQKGIKIDINLINNVQKQSDMSQTPDRQQQMLPSISSKQNSKNYSDFVGKRQISANNQPSLNSIQNIQNIYQNANQKITQQFNQNKLNQPQSSKKSQNKNNSNSGLCQKIQDNFDENADKQKDEQRSKLKSSEINEEKSNFSKNNETQDTDQSTQGYEGQNLKENSREEFDNLKQQLEQRNQDDLKFPAKFNEMTFHFNEIKIDNQINKNADSLVNNNYNSNNQLLNTQINKNDQIETQDSLKENRQLLDEIEEEENTNRDLQKDAGNCSLQKQNSEQKQQFITPNKIYGQKNAKQLIQSSTEEKKFSSKQRNLDFLERNLSICQNNQDDIRADTSCTDFKRQKRRQQSKSQHQELTQNQGTFANSQQDMNQTIYEKIKICDDLINQEKSTEDLYLKHQEDYFIDNKSTANENKNNLISSSNPQKKITASRLQKFESTIVNNSFRNSSKNNYSECVIQSNKENIPIIPKSRNSNTEENKNQNEQHIGGIFDINTQFQQQLKDGSTDDKLSQFKQIFTGKNKTKDSICSVLIMKSNKSKSKQKYVEDLSNQTLKNNNNSNQKDQFIKQLTNKLQEAITIKKDSIKTLENGKIQNDLENEDTFKLPSFKQEKETGNKGPSLSKVINQIQMNKKNLVSMNTSYEQNERKKQFSTKNQLQNKIFDNDKSFSLMKDLSFDLSTPIIAPPAGSSEYTSLKSRHKQSQRSKSIQDEGINGFNYSKCQEAQIKNTENALQSNFTTISQQQYITITNPISQNTSIDVTVNDPNKFLVNNQAKRQMKLSSIPKTPKINSNFSTKNTNQQVNNNKEELDNSKFTLPYQQSYAHHAKVQNLKCKEFYNLLTQGQVSNSTTSQSTKLAFDSNNTSSQQCNKTDNKLSIETPYSSSSRHIKRKSLRFTYMTGCGIPSKSFLSTSNNYENALDTSTQNTAQPAKSIQYLSINGFSSQSNNLNNQVCQDDSQSFCDTLIRDRNSISMNQGTHQVSNKNGMLSNQESPNSTFLVSQKAKMIGTKTFSETQNQDTKNFDQKLLNDLGVVQKSQQNKLKSILQDYNLTQKDGKIVQQNQNKLIKSSLE